MKQRGNNERALVIVDGSVPSVLALWSEGVLTGPAAGAARENRSGPVAFVTGLLGRVGDEPPGPATVAQRTRLTERCQVSDVIPDDLLDRGRWGLSDPVGLLVRACAVAIEHGCKRVIWAHSVGLHAAGSGSKIEEVSRCFERAVIVSRLMNLELPASKQL